MPMKVHPLDELEQRPIKPQMVLPKTPQHPLQTQSEWRLRQRQDSRDILYSVLFWLGLPLAGYLIVQVVMWLALHWRTVGL